MDEHYNKDLEKLHEIELEMLKEFHKFCVENDLRYFIIGGTLLGAIRHGGFIPWDDDVDVGMPRRDFEKLKKLWNQNAPEHLRFSFDLRENNINFIPKILNLKTQIYERSIETDWHVYIEVFPFDGVSRWKILSTFKVLFIRYLNRCYFIYKLRVNKKLRYRDLNRLVFKPTKNPLEILKRSIIFFTTLLLPSKFFSKIPKLIDKLAKKYDFDSSEYIVNYYGAYGLREVVRREWVEPQVLVKFEDAEFYAPNNWHNYLTRIYGDYMVVLPPEKRVNHNIRIING